MGNWAEALQIMQSYDESFYAREVGPALKADYAEAHRQIGDDAAWVVWPARIEADVARNGLTYPGSLSKHRAEWRAALGLPQPPAVLLPFRGNFCVPGAIPGLPWAPDGRLWTPAYGCYTDQDRATIRQVYRAHGYTHFPYNCAGLPYGSDYPELADDPSRVARDLVELKSAGLLPLVCATDDRKGGQLAQGFLQNPGLITACFPMWEQNGVLNNDEQAQKDLILRVRQAAPLAACFLHFTPGHGSISANEAAGWHWCQDQGVRGLLAQGSNEFPAGDPATEGAGLESTAIRLLGRTDLGAPPDWAGLTQVTIKFEYGISRVYRGGVSEADQVAYTQAFLAHAPHVAGFCDGGQ